jgi:hypothetical protein
VRRLTKADLLEQYLMDDQLVTVRRIWYGNDTKNSAVIIKAVDAALNKTDYAYVFLAI